MIRWLGWGAVAVAISGCAGGEECTWYPDADRDGFGDASAAPFCDADTPSGFVQNRDDCNDADSAIRPGAGERCDEQGVDEDCNGLVNDDDPAVQGKAPTWPDADGDGFGEMGASTVLACEAPGGRTFIGGDCDDTDNETFPGAAPADSADACMTNRDGDDYGATAPASGVLPGTDCDDDEAATYPGAPEFFGDQIDQNCDGTDLFEFVDNFELRKPDPEVWQEIEGSFAPVSGTLGSSTNLQVSAPARLVTPILNASRCESLVWSAWVDVGWSNNRSVFAVEYYDGKAWNDAAVVSDPRPFEATPSPMHGAITAPGAYIDELRLAFSIRQRPNSTGLAWWDDLRFACAGVDADGDGFGELDDCDDADARHFTDCGVCVDGDDDGFGEGCDLGADCDDTDAHVQPGAADLAADGVDNDCNGFDGIGFYDDFGLGTRNPLVWEAIDGQWFVSDVAVDNARVLYIIGHPTTATSVPIDTSTCTNLYATMDVSRLFAESGDRLRLEFGDGVDWTLMRQVEGGAGQDPQPRRYTAVINEPRALAAGTQFRLHTQAANALFAVDEVMVACSGPDSDGDGFPEGFECNDDDARHWADCDTCVDIDDDGFGAGCDLGADCNDIDADVRPYSPDPSGDGVDADCSGADGPGLADSFELGRITAPWEEFIGESAYSNASARTGQWSLWFSGQDTLAISQPWDTSACDAIIADFYARRSGLPFGFGILFEWFDGTDWQAASKIDGGVDDADFLPYSAVLDSAAAHPDFRFRFRVDTLSPDVGAFIDDVSLNCRTSL